MATIEFSPAAVSSTDANANKPGYSNFWNYDGGPINAGGGTSGSGGSLAVDGFSFLKTTASAQNRIVICKGTKPTSIPASYTSITPDALVVFEPSTHYSATVGPITQGLTGTTFWTEVKTTFANATASGVATWFGIVLFDSSTNTMTNLITGTVGTTGSGADMVISDTNIVSGLPYRVLQLRFEMSTIWTY